MRMAISRVVEVFEAPGKRLWKAPDWDQAPGATLAPDGSIKRVA
jgi:hypothetical protein